MYNIINELQFYKGKSVLIIEVSIGVSYGKAVPFINFKFAPRQDFKSPGVWDNANTYWLSSYVELYSFVKDLTAFVEGKLEKVERSNPGKKTALNVYKTTNEKTSKDYYNFHFFRGETKISVPLEKIDIFPICAYLKNLLDNYSVVAQIANMKYDIWYQGQQGNTDKKAPVQKSSYTKSNNSSSQNYNNNSSSKETPSNNYHKYDNTPLDNYESVMDDINAEDELPF